MTVHPPPLPLALRAPAGNEPGRDLALTPPARAHVHAPPRTPSPPLPHAHSCFGELALLYSAPRAATVRATMRCKLWVMERAVYHAVKRNFTHEQFVARHKLLESVPAIRNLPSHQKALLADALQEVRPPERTQHGWRGAGTGRRHLC